MPEGRVGTLWLHGALLNFDQFEVFEVLTSRQYFEEVFKVFGVPYLLKPFAFLLPPFS